MEFLVGDREVAAVAAAAVDAPPVAAGVGVESVQVAVRRVVDGTVEFDEVSNGRFRLASPDLFACLGASRDDRVPLDGVAAVFDEADRTALVDAPAPLAVLEPACFASLVTAGENGVVGDRNARDRVRVGRAPAPFGVVSRRRRRWTDEVVRERSRRAKPLAGFGFRRR